MAKQPSDLNGYQVGASPAEMHTLWLSQMRLGSTLALSGDAVSAVNAFVRAGELRPDHAPTRRQLAAALLRAGEHARALDEFNKLIAGAPASSDDLHGRALALHGLGEHSLALEAFRRAVATDPAAWKSLNSISDITPSESERLNALGRSAFALEQLVQDTSASSQLVAEFGEALLSAHRFADAADFAIKHAARFKSQASAQNLLARAHYNAGRFGDAFVAKLGALAAIEPRIAAPCRSPARFDPGTAKTALRELLTILSARGIDAFLVAGTLLGFQRSGGPLSHDRDLDIGVIRSSEGVPDISALLRAEACLIHPRAARAGDRYFGLNFKGVAVDIFVHDHEGDGLVCGLGRIPGDIQWRVSRFATMQINYTGENWPVPDQTNRYLAEFYGPNWQTPDMGFASVVSSPALYKTAVDARAYYAASRAVTALLCGNREKAEALACQSPRSFSLPQTSIDGDLFNPDTEETDKLS